ncbi:kinectin isoform X1 [Hemibagrus wyckioides]|uniref:kinectin isoform X1 n=1 Tax=Hemibagrus wyckioides TaxID=337641 RepID=UPI00266BE854|nr:kinectin isoform X1 [Hemibagrus wyckioides]
MAIEVADSQYLLILAPSLVIILMFLFFWLFMKETSYDEVLARQKRDLKLPPVKTDARKKGEKKKNKKKENTGNEGGGGKGSESQDDLQDFDLVDATSSTLNNEVPEVVPVPLPVSVPVQAEPPTGVRERKKKEKKAKASASVATAAPSPAPVTTEKPEVNGSKPAVRKEQTVPLSKQPSPPQAQAPPPAPATAETTGKKKAKKQKSETEEPPAEVKPDQSPVVVKKVEPVLAEHKLQDGAAPVAVPPAPTTSTGSGRRKSKKQKMEAAVTVNETQVQSSPPASQTNSVPPANHQSSKNDEAAAPSPARASTKQSKKQKNETDKENSRVKLKELLASLGGLVLSDADVVSVVSLLRDKSPNALDSWYKSATKFEPSAQQLAEKERLLTTLQEEASIAKDKVKQLSQELQAEKQKNNRAEAMLREQRVAMEKEMSVMQAKAQGSYQELQSMQIKFQTLREQMEGQINRLQKENNIFRDAVSSASTQIDNKQNTELNNLRSECSGLMKDLAEIKNKLQQEELQRKSLEVNYKQNVSQLEAQLQDAKRRWEELQSYLHSVNTEREKLQAAKQELQSQLLAVETEMTNKNKEIQTLHSSLTDTMVSKEQVEQKVMQLLEVSQHNLQPDNSLQAQVQDLMTENKSLKVQIENLQHQVTSQANAVSHFEELQKLLAEKELQRKSLEDSLNAERSSGASRETNLQAFHSENVFLKAEVHRLNTQLSEQASSLLAVDQLKQSLQEKEEKIKTVETVIETGLIEVANKEEELKIVREENDKLKRHVEALQQQTAEQKQSDTTLLEGLQRQIQEKDEKVRSVEESLKSSLTKESSRVKVIEDLEKKLENMTAELGKVQSRGTQENTDMRAQLLELQSRLTTKDQAIQRLEKQLEEKAREVEEKMVASTQLLELQAQFATKEQELQVLQKEMEEQSRQAEEKIEQKQQQMASAVPSKELLTAIAEKDRQLSDVQSELHELKEKVELYRKKNNELREKNWCAMEALSATETMLQGKLSKTVKESQTSLEAAEAECRAVLHRLLPHVPLPTDQSHKAWLQKFESSMMEASAREMATANQAPSADDAYVQDLREKLKEAEETQKVLQKDCETYKKVLADTEGILQRLQSSVEQEECHWREKLELAQSELREMTLKVTVLEQEVDRLSSDGELESLRREKQHLEFELERAERESATYVSEVRELKDLLTELQSKLDGSYTEAVRQNEELNLLKTQLTETLGKLKTEESERLKVAGDLYKAQQSLELIQEEIIKEAGLSNLIQNSSLTTEEEKIEHKEKMSAGLNQTVQELQELLQAVNRQLTKGQERCEGDK